MRVNQAAIVLTIFLSTLSVAQRDDKSPKKVKPDFTGTWVLTESQSKGDTDISNYFLTINHREPEISLTKQYTRGKKQITEKLTYYTDGRAEINPGQRPNDPSPKTRWQGAKLVRRSVSRAAGSLTAELVTYEEWSLSDDRQTLTRSIELTIGSSLIARTKKVFKRQQ